MSIVKRISLLPLQARTVLVTRTEEGNLVEKKKLEALGANVVEFSGIETADPTDKAPLVEATRRLSSFDWIVFTSANGVKYFFEKLHNTSDIKASFACVGPKTQRELEAHGFKALLVPTEFLTDALGRELVSSFDLRKKKILLARAEVARKDIAWILRNAGADVLEVPVYKTVPRERVDMDRDKILLERVTDVTLTSPSTAEAFVSNFGVDEILARKIKVHSIGPVTTNRARQIGLNVATTASIHTIDGLVDAMIRTVESS